MVQIRNITAATEVHVNQPKYSWFTCVKNLLLLLLLVLLVYYYYYYYFRFLFKWKVSRIWILKVKPDA